MVCEPGFFQKHVGVRALVSTLVEQAKAFGHSVSYVINEPTHLQDRWFLAVPQQSLVDGNFVDQTESVSGVPDEVLLRYQNELFEVKQADFPPNLRVAYYALGSQVPEGMFDMAIYSGPWLQGLQQRFPAKRVVGLVHDAIPNSYLLNGKATDDFAYQHLTGFRCYTAHCDEIWANSAFTRSAFLALCTISRLNSVPVHILPPMIPHHIACHLASTDMVSRENMVVAVGLFDPRKGLAEASKIFDAVTKPVHLAICGAIRCREEDMRDFIARLRVERVTWYRSIRSEDLAALYAKARVAIFNSDAEGLGLPVLEAQALGCPVVASDIPVLQDILLPGSIGLPRDAHGAFAAYIDNMLAGGTDHVGLAATARTQFVADGYGALLNEVPVVAIDAA